MVTAQSTIQSRSPNRPRPANLRTDGRQIWQLLDIVFEPHLDVEGRQALDSHLYSSSPGLMLQLSHATSGLVPGFVWEENGRIIGNISLLPTKKAGRFLIANVAVHPRARQQGIGQALLDEAIRHIRSHQGQSIWLQVKKDNEAAIRLYERAGFEALGSLTTWDLAKGPIRELAVHNRRLFLPGQGDARPALVIRPLRSHEWRAAYELELTGMKAELNWPEPPAEDKYKMGFWRWLADFFTTQQMETWVMADPQHQLLGLATITTEWGRSHQITVRARPEWQGQIERPLLAKVMRLLSSLRQRGARLDHPSADETMNELLREGNWRPRRTLEVMRLKIKDEG
jgi:ribosomal protein S18 acetylase RimI-like enzyme